MILAAAFCPHPPMLVPEVAAGAAGDLAPLRDACLDALGDVLAADPEVLVLVGASSGLTRPFGPDAVASFAGLGVDLLVPLAAAGSSPAAAVDEASPRLPLALAVGAWLVARSGWPGRRVALGVDPEAPPAACAAAGAHLVSDGGAAGDRRVGLLVMADGSAARSPRAPRSLDPRAAPFDAGVAAALGAGDPAALAGVDPAVAAAVGASGRAAWQYAAGATGHVAPRWDARLRYDHAPFGVGYLVASWSLPASPAPAG